MLYAVKVYASLFRFKHRSFLCDSEPNTNFLLLEQCDKIYSNKEFFGNNFNVLNGLIILLVLYFMFIVKHFETFYVVKGKVEYTYQTKYKSEEGYIKVTYVDCLKKTEETGNVCLRQKCLVLS